MRKKILIVDDEEAIREVLVDAFEVLGFGTVEAENGTIAFEKLQKEPVDAVISDVRMAGGDGETLLRNIRAANKEHPVVLLITGFADLTEEEAKDLGANAYFHKPFKVREIVETVNNLVSKT